MRADQVVKVPAWDLPFFRHEVAKHFKVQNKVCFVTYGGIGDVLCTEPTIRYTLEILKPALGIESITVATMYPDLFKHLDVEILPMGKTGKLAIEGGYEKYYFLYCGHPEGNLQHRFYTHNDMLPVDYPALSCLRMQLPLRYRYIETSFEDTPNNIDEKFVVVHPGNHWESKRYPLKWWNEILERLCSEGLTPVIIGGPPGKDNGTVSVDSVGCLDLREKISFAQSASIMNKVKVVITNDSFPLHLGTTGKAHIGFFATAKDPEWLMHWRMTDNFEVKFGWRMENLALGGAYQRSFSPTAGGNHLSKASQGEVIGWLPKPEVVLEWVKKKLNTI